MFGSLRILLAIGVALSHVGITIFGYNLGVASVVAFYLISGYVTSHLLDTQLKTPSDYYWERSLRLLPSYWGALGIAALIWLILRPENSLFLQRAPDWIDWLSNITVISLNFYMWSGQDQFMPIPTAWSLAAELQFYLLAPWILMLNQRNRFIVTLASLLVWVAAQTGFLQTDWWGYRLLPGILLMFLMGACVLRHERWMLGLVWLTAAIVFCAIMAGLIGAQPYNVETSVGAVARHTDLNAAIATVPQRLGRFLWPAGISLLSSALPYVVGLAGGGLSGRRASQPANHPARVACLHPCRQLAVVLDLRIAADALPPFAATKVPCGPLKAGVWINQSL